MLTRDRSRNCFASSILMCLANSFATAASLFWNDRSALYLIIRHEELDYSVQTHRTKSAARSPAEAITRVCGLPLSSDALPNLAPFSGLYTFKKSGN